MFLPFNTQPANDFTALQHAIQHDIENIDDADEFLYVDETGDEVIAMICNAGSFY